MRRAWIFAWAWTVGAVLAVDAQIPVNVQNAFKVANLPSCILARQGWVRTVNDADPDCSGGSGVAGSQYALCLCDPILGWLPILPGDSGGGAPSGAAGGDLAGTYPDPTIAANAVALGTDTTGGYAASATEAGAATSVASNSVALGTDTTGGYAASGTEAGAATSALSVTGFTGPSCARFNGSGSLVAASGDCAAGDTDTTNAGTVTTVSVTTENGISGTVATSTTTPAITLSLGAIAPGSVAASGSVTGSNLSGTNTGDQTTISGNAATATALAANPNDCDPDEFATDIAANGNLACAQVDYSQISGAPAAGIGGALGADDNRIVRTDGAGGATVQPSAASVDDNGRIQTGGGSAGGINLGGNGARIVDSNSDGRLDFHTAGATRLDIVDLGGVWAMRFANGGPIVMGAGANAKIGTANEYLQWGGGDGTAWNAQGASDTTQRIAWTKGDYSGISRGLRAYRSVQVSTAGSGAPLVLVEADTSRVLHSEGATAEAYFTLPAAAAGLSMTFVVSDADGLRVTAAAGDVIHIGGLGALGVDLPSSPGGECHSSTVANSVTLQAVNATDWFATSVVGLGWSCS